MSDSWFDVELNEMEMTHAALVGARRHHNAMSKGYKDAVEEKGDLNTSLARHVNGAAGELAVAKFAGQYWGGHVDTFKGPDLGKAVQVRTRTRHDWELPVRDGDADDHAFILVTGCAPSFRIHGWIMGRDAKNPEWLKAVGGMTPAYFVPKEALHPMTKATEEVA